MKLKKIKLIEAIELGLNLIAQDLVYPNHTEKEIRDYINQFKFTEVNKNENSRSCKRSNN